MKRSYHSTTYFMVLCLTLCGLVVGSSPRVVNSNAQIPAVGPGRAKPIAEPLPELRQTPPVQLQTELVEAVESGDPDAPPDKVTIDQAEVEDQLRESHALFAFSAEQRSYKEDRKVAEAMLDYTLSLAHQSPPVTRETRPGQVRRIVGLYGLRSENVAFCAIGVAYAAARAFCDVSPRRIIYSREDETSTLKNVLPIIKKYYFTPHPLCRYMVMEAKKRSPTQSGGWVAKGSKRPMRAWIVVFDWDKDGVADHVGIVRSVGPRASGLLHTVEFNTCINDGGRRKCGAVAEKERNMDQVMGFIRTYGTS
jgi:hypothetical protein